MTIEIFYKGEVIKTVALSDITDIEGIQFGFRMMSKGEQREKLAPVKLTRKRFIKDTPRAPIPEKEVVKFERPKAVYTNTRKYDF